MLIRCQRCRALFSLQDGVAGGAGSFKVECGRCLSVFDAELPSKAGTQPAPPPPASAPGVAERRAAGEELAKVLRSESGPHRPAALVWITALIVLAALAFAVQRARLSGVSRAAGERMQKAREALLRDDAESLQQAAALFTEAARLAPEEAAPEGERAFAVLLQAATHLSLADHGELRYLQDGLAMARVALDDDPENPAALRALALHAALTGAPDRGTEAIDRAARRAPRDPWIAYTRAALALAAPQTRESQDRALSALAAARQAEPRMLRAQVEVAAISAARGEAGPARSVLLAVLRQNPKHERAQRLLASLPAAP